MKELSPNESVAEPNLSAESSSEKTVSLEKVRMSYILCIPAGEIWDYFEVNKSPDLENIFYYNRTNPEQTWEPRQEGESIPDEVKAELIKVGSDLTDGIVFDVAHDGLSDYWLVGPVKSNSKFYGRDNLIACAKMRLKSSYSEDDLDKFAPDLSGLLKIIEGEGLMMSRDKKKVLKCNEAEAEAYFEPDSPTYLYTKRNMNEEFCWLGTQPPKDTDLGLSLEDFRKLPSNTYVLEVNNEFWLHNQVPCGVDAWDRPYSSRFVTRLRFKDEFKKMAEIFLRQSRSGTHK